MLRKISSLSLRVINKNLNPIRAYSSTNILSKLSFTSKIPAVSQARRFLPPALPPIRAYSSLSSIIEKMIEERSKQEEILKKESEQLLALYKIKENHWIHNDRYTPLTVRFPKIYYSNKKTVLHELIKIDHLNQKSFDKLSPKNIESAANSLDLLKEMKLYNQENTRFFFSLDSYDQLDSILTSFKIRHELFNEDYSLDTLNKRFEFIKKNPDAIIGIGYLARTTIEWQDIVNLLQANGAELFNDKAFIAHLVYNSNITLNISIGENREIIQQTLKLLNEKKEIISAVVNELKSDTHQYRYIKNDIIPVLINLAKKSELPSQLEHDLDTISWTHRI